MWFDRSCRRCPRPTRFPLSRMGFVAEYVARFIARTQQRYTQRGGMRPFGVSSMLAGFSQDGQPQIYQVPGLPLVLGRCHLRLAMRSVLWMSSGTCVVTPQIACFGGSTHDSGLEIRGSCTAESNLRGGAVTLG